ncbi:MAG: glycosyltransferase family 2 protein [Ignavibacteria bacterium]|nr:glycosyltransferase family 2 protein [Ignavibacteria bacterium]
MLFSIIIINHNQKDFLERCIESVRQNLTGNYEIIVVDNSDNQDDYEIENVKIIKSPNRGFAHANNLASRYASGKYLLFLNADTEFRKDFVPYFCENFSGTEFGAAGLGLVYPDGSRQLSFWHENTFAGEIKNKKLEDGFKKKDDALINEFFSGNSVKEVEWVSGAAMIIPKDIFESVGGFNEKFFLFYEDADICKRIQQKGHKILFIPFDGLVHFKGEYVNDKFAGDTYYHSKKSQLLYYRVHNGITQRILLRVYLFLKFGALTLTAGGVNKKIFKLILGIRND